MKRFKNLTKVLICMILCVFTIGLAACKDDNNDSSNFVFPSSNSETVSNGGLVVQKGEYVYFVNGFLSYSNMPHKNASYSIGALLIAKLDNNGGIVLNDDKLLHDDYYTAMSNKLCGFEATNLYIFGEYLYFTSPCQLDDTNETWAKGRVDFYRIKLDKSGSVQHLYESEVENSSLEYAYYENAGKTYLLVYEKGENLDNSSMNNVLYRVDVTSGSKSSGEVIAKNVTSVVMPDYSKDSDYKNIFYVEYDSSNSKNPYTVVNYNIVAKVKSINKPFSSTVSVEHVANDFVFYKTSDNDLMRVKIQNFATNNGEFVCFADIYTSITYMPNSEGVIVFTEDDKMFEYFLVGNTTPIKLATDDNISSITIIGLSNGCIVYVDDNYTIKKISYSNHIAGQSIEIEIIASISDIDIGYFDIAEGYVYFYKTIGSNQYLHRIIINNNTSEEIVEEMFGVYNESDIPETEEEDEEEY